MCIFSYSFQSKQAVHKFSFFLFSTTFYRNGHIRLIQFDVIVNNIVLDAARVHLCFHLICTFIAPNRIYSPTKCCINVTFIGIAVGNDVILTLLFITNE